MEIFNDILNEKVIGTQYEKLNNLIISSVKNEEDLQSIWPHLQSQNSMHDYIKMFLIDRFKMYDELMDIFKSTDKRLICKALKCNWFFEGENKNIVCIEYFEEKLFPFISFTTKVKILHQIAVHLKDKTRIKDFYEVIERKYDFNQALVLLPACPLSLIKQVIEMKKKIPEKILIQIAKQDIELSVLYYQLDSPDCSKYVSLMEYIVSHNIDYYLKFLMKKSFVYSFTFNHKITKYIFSKYEFQFILDNINYLRFDYEYVYKLLPKSQIFQLMVALCPDKFKHFTLRYGGSYKRLIDMHPIQEHYEILVNLLKAKYNMDITEFKHKIDEDLLRKMPTNERQKWAEIFIKDEDVTNKENYLKFCPTNVSIPQLKEILKKTTDYWNRASLIASLVDTCFINKDMKSLTHIITFIEDRFRNDHQDVKTRFLEVFLQNENVSMLDASQWEIIYKFIQILNIKSEFKYESTVQSMLFKHLEYNFVNNKPIEELLLYILKNIASHGWYRVFENFSISGPLKYVCLELILKKLPEIVPLNESYWENEKSVLELVRYIYNYNQENPDKKVNLKDTWLDEKYQTILNKNPPCSKLKIIDKSELDAKTKEELNEYYLLNDTSNKLLINYIRWKPEKVIQNLDKILNNILGKSLSKYIRFFRNIRSLDFLNLPNEITNKCLEIIKSELPSEKKPRAVTLICILGNSKKIDEIIQPYLPIEETLTVEEENELYLVKKTFAQSLCKVQRVVDFSLLSKFLFKDYLNLALGSLYSTCLNTPEYTTKAFVTENITNRVSIKKHAIRILFTIGSKSETYEMLENVLKKEKNSSMRGIVFKMILNIFYSEPTKENFQLLDLIFDQITSADSENIPLLLQIKKIPASFLQDYCIKIWKILNIEFNQIEMEKIEISKGDFVRVLKDQEIFSNLKSSFLMDIINYYLNLGQEKNIKLFSSLVIKFILNTKDSSLVEQCISSFFEYFEQNIKKNQEIHNREKEFFFRNQILIFVGNLIKRTLKEWYCDDYYIFDMIYELLNDQDHPEYYFEERIYIEMLKVYKINKGDCYQFGQNCVPFINKHFYEYQSDLIHPLLFKIINNFLDKIINFETVAFCHGLIDHNNSAPCRLLALEKLSSHYCIESEKEVYDKVINEIFKNKNLRFHNYKFLLKN